MRQSKLFGKTMKETPKNVSSKNHELLYRAGYIRESVAGRYYFLPLGMRVHEKIQKIVEQEMDKTGAQRIVTPTLHQLELWEETNRTNTAGFELMTVEDRRGARFALGGTAEEMIVDLARKFQISYKDLPFNIYQFSNKFRDELRAKGGLMRVREFVMKDAYSFHIDEKDFTKEYQVMGDTYTKIFNRLGLQTVRVEADNGYIGGDYCHEYIADSEVGESRYFISEDDEYKAHEDVAKFDRDNKNIDDPERELIEAEAKRGTTMEDGMEFHNLPLWQQMKDVMFADENNNLILAVVRGDLDVNATKLLNVANVAQLRAATEDEIRAIGSEPGFICPVKISDKVRVIGDTSLRTVKNFYGGANKKNLDNLNINIDRDFKCEIEADIALAKNGYEFNGHKLHERKGVEVGNIFQLGEHYSKLMNATYRDKDGTDRHYYMGCYGLGIGRTMATIAELHNNDKGLVWPESVAPYAVHLVGIGDEGSDSIEAADKLYKQLQEKGIEVLYDDRDVRPGQKFADSDLIGIPLRVVISPKTLEAGGIEVKGRTETDPKIVTEDELLVMLTQ